tara:strand:+ start:75 stop:368 length:294 start_codon:yes stop_codon:yes gene_type:complete
MGLFIMTFSEDTNLFFEHFSVDVIFNSITYKGILEQPDEIIADGLVMTTDYQLTAKTLDLGGLIFDNIVEINNEKYKVRNSRKIDDGTFCLVSLMKV